jgi:ferritin
MVSKKVVKLLNEQIAMESDSSQIYLAAAGWAEHNAFRGTAGFMFRQIDIDEQPEIPAVKEPKASYKDIEEVFSESLKHERKVTASINNIFSAARENNDYAVTSFLKWFVDEQVEEEATAQHALDIIRMAGKVSMYLADKEIGALRAAK